MKNLEYNTKKYKVSQRTFNRRHTAKTESIFALGNGYLGLRSSDEEVEFFNTPNLFVNGVFNRDHKEDVPELANLADSTQTQIFFDNQPFTILKRDKYTKTLDFKNGILTRNILVSRNNKKINMEFERFVSQDVMNIYAQKITIKFTKSTDTQELLVNILPQINGQVTNSGTQHFKEGKKYRTSANSLRLEQETTHSNIFCLHNLTTKVYLNGKTLVSGNDDYFIDIKRRKIFFNIKVTMKPGDVLVIEKLMSINTSINSSDKKLEKNKVLEKSEFLLKELLNSNYNDLLKKSIKAMNEKVWKSFYVNIEGDKFAEYDLFALKFGIFHMNSFTPKHSSNLNIGAKGLTGEGYQGHTYWDTEFFINPNYLFTNPLIVKKLLTYRYKGINGARKKALEIKKRDQESNLLGAQYPWEMAWPTDGEVCPYWGQADIVTGQQIPIASRRQEIHVSAAIAYAVNQYYKVTGDEEFMIKHGYEMIIDTGYFYANRSEKINDTKYVINDIMGPNEYKGNVNNNAYTNFLAKYNIELAIEIIERLEKTNPSILQAILKKIPYEINLEKMKKIAKFLYQQTPNKELIIPENDEFLNLPLSNIEQFKMLGDAGKKLFSTTEGQKILSSQLVKQADVVLLTYLFPHLYNKETIQKNFDYYEKATTHDSSLSASTYSIVATRLRKIEQAYDLFKYSINIDLGQNMRSSDTGVHAGSLAAIWQMIVFGFGGMGWYNDEINLDPFLPSNWAKLSYRVKFQGKLIEVNVFKDKFNVKTVEKNTEIYLKVLNHRQLITNEEKEFEVRTND